MSSFGGRGLLRSVKVRPDFGPHFLITSEAEAATGAESIQLDGVEAFAAWDDGTHGLGPEQLGDLHCVVLGCTRDYSLLDDYKIVFSHDEMHGPWLIRVPDELVITLASLDAAELETIGERWWQASSGFQFRQAPRDWVQRLALRLVKLAKRAVEQRNALYLELPSC
jgi:hypothetical protein